MSNFRYCLQHTHQSPINKAEKQVKMDIDTPAAAALAETQDGFGSMDPNAT
jgi:hypothetical protein